MQPGRPPSPELDQFLAAYDPGVRTLALRLRALVLDEAPRATELIYDAYNAVAIAFTSTGRQADAFCHVAVYSGHVNLGFNQGAGLPDPGGLLKGSGKRIRHIKVLRPEELEQPHLREFVRLAAAGAPAAQGAESPARSRVQAISSRKRRPG